MTSRRRSRSDEAGHGTVLYPAIARAAQLLGAQQVCLIDIGCSAGLNLIVDRIGITYSNGQSLGDEASTVQLAASVVGRRSLPTQAIPEVVARIGIDRAPIDVTDPDDVRWMRDCLLANPPDRAAVLDAAIALAAMNPLELIRGDPVEDLGEALNAVQSDTLPVFITTWALSRFAIARRLRFLEKLQEAAADRLLAWVSVEGVGVAPSIPTLGDRPASGHSIIGVAVSDRPGPGGLRAEAVGRCWSRGRLLSWLVES